MKKWHCGENQESKNRQQIEITFVSDFCGTRNRV